VAIDYFCLLGDATNAEGWTPMTIDPAGRSQHWIDGTPLDAAPVDVAATFDGAMWRSTKIDPAFNVIGVKLRGGFTMPRHHQSLRQLVIVFGGDLRVEHGDEERTVGPGQFFVISAAMPYTLTAGAEGATFIETWPEPVTKLETYWHDFGWVHR
jgi:quercetin dioxygenase-like cupin family protein